MHAVSTLADSRTLLTWCGECSRALGGSRWRGGTSRRRWTTGSACCTRMPRASSSGSWKPRCSDLQLVLCCARISFWHLLSSVCNRSALFPSGLQVLSKAELQFLALLPELRPKVRVIAECGNWYIHFYLHLNFRTDINLQTGETPRHFVTISSLLDAGENLFGSH